MWSDERDGELCCKEKAEKETRDEVYLKGWQDAKEALLQQGFKYIGTMYKDTKQGLYAVGEATRLLNKLKKLTPAEDVE